MESSNQRFKGILRRRLRENLKKYISKGEMIGKRDGEKISIPIPNVDIPRFKFNFGEGEGEGQGSGEGDAGDKAGEHVIEVNVTLEELADILGEELGLRNLEPKGRSNIVSEKTDYCGIRRAGPESLRHFKRTYRQALKRQISEGTFDRRRPLVVPVREDKRYRGQRKKEEPELNAAIIYMMDVSGSMGEEQKQIARIESFWISTWLRRHYKGIEERFIIHDAVSREVDRQTFFTTRESGGTMISSAYATCANIMAYDYPSSDWNIYPIHFSDGDNWSNSDTEESIKIMDEGIVPFCNQFSYSQIRSPYGSGQFIKDLRKHYGEESQVVITSKTKDRDGIMQTIKDFFGPLPGG
jgi:uncharacterized sporulation protein YeaH/YhbH (DUF444 family)